MNFVIFLDPFGHQLLDVLEFEDRFVQVGFGILLRDVGAVAGVNHPRGHHPTVLFNQVAEIRLTHLQHVGHLQNQKYRKPVHKVQNYAVFGISY